MNKERVAGSLPGIPVLLALVVAVLAIGVGIIYYIGAVLVGWTCWASCSWPAS
jgi:hypothetical protein